MKRLLLYICSVAVTKDISASKRYTLSPYLQGKTIFGDKIYNDLSYFNDDCTTTMLTPFKQVKGEAEVIRQREKAVSNVRQPIEAFFNWLNEKTEIQRASKVRTTKGLLVHIFGKLAIAILSYANL